MKPRESGMLLVHQAKGHSTLRGLYLVSLQWMFDEGDIQQLFFSLVIFSAIIKKKKKNGESMVVDISVSSYYCYVFNVPSTCTKGSLCFTPESLCPWLCIFCPWTFCPRISFVLAPTLKKQQKKPWRLILNHPSFNMYKTDFIWRWSCKRVH